MVLLLALSACQPKDPGCTPVAEVPYDGVDQDCDGVDRTDVDGDGSPAPADCDDADPDRAPGRTEVPGDGVDQDCDGADAIALGERRGTGIDASFGQALVFQGTALWVGAPWARGDGAPGGAVTRDGLGELEGAPGERLGRALVALADGTVLIGVPGAGEVRDATGEVRAAGAGVGRVLAARGDRWVVGTDTGARWDDGTEVTWGAAPDAVWILPDGTLVGGFARGERALVIGPATELARPAAQDEAGFALASWEPRGDGRSELLVGAPGAGVVYRVDPDAPAFDHPVAGGAGRFGAAITAEATHAWIGAPMAGDAAEGAVSTLAPDDTLTPALTGANPGDQLGFALALGPGVWAVGAPGRADAPGSVFVQAR